jgi:hypothetical protein
MEITYIKTTVAMCGGMTVGPAASKANDSFPFAMLSVFIVIAVISRFYK